MVAGGHVKMMIAPQHLNQVKGQLTLAGLKPTIYIEDIQQ